MLGLRELLPTNALLTLLKRCQEFPWNLRRNRFLYFTHTCSQLESLTAADHTIRLNWPPQRTIFLFFILIISYIHCSPRYAGDVEQDHLGSPLTQSLLPAVRMEQKSIPI